MLPVNVLLHVAGHVEVDDMFHVGDVQTSGGHGCGHYDGGLATFEPETQKSILYLYYWQQDYQPVVFF